MKINPFVAMRPSTRSETDIYSVERNLFTLNKESTTNLVGYLNTVDIVYPTGINEVDRKCLEYNVYSYHQRAALCIPHVEYLAEKYGCNVLGSCFLAWLQVQGIQIGKSLGPVNIEPTDVEFITTIYPDLKEYFEDPSLVDQNQRSYAEGVIYNNSGNFTVVEVGGNFRSFSRDNLATLTVLKRVYRDGVRNTIQHNSPIRDNVIHTPENYDELQTHIKLFEERIPNQCEIQY